MVIINTNKITELKNKQTGHNPFQTTQSESLLMRAPAGPIVPKTPYFVQFLKPSNPSTLEPRDEDDVKIAELVFVKNSFDASALKQDIDNGKAAYVFRADKRTLFSIEKLDDASKTALESVSIDGSQTSDGVLVFAVKGAVDTTISFATTLEYSNNAMTTILSVPIYGAEDLA